MESVYRIVNVITKGGQDRRNRGTYTLQFVDYIDQEGEDEPMEIVRNSIELTTGQIFRDALNLSEGKALHVFAINKDTTLDYARYIEFIKEINRGLSREAMQFCFNVYEEFYNSGKSKDAYVPTMNVRMELDCTEDGYLVEYFYYEDYENLLVYDFYSAIKERIAIKHCALCGTYFLTQNRTDEMYCSAICRSVVSKQRSKIHHRLDDDNELLKRRIASRLQQRTKIANDALREDREAVHKKFLFEVKDWKKRIKNGTATSEQYREWLELQDAKYSVMVERKEETEAAGAMAEAVAVPASEPAPRVISGAKLNIKPAVFKDFGSSEEPEESGAAAPQTELPAAALEPAVPVEEPAPQTTPEHAPEPDTVSAPQQNKNDNVPYEERGLPEAMKARIMRFANRDKSKSEKEKNFAIRQAVFPTLESVDPSMIIRNEPEKKPEPSYEDLGAKIENSGAEDMDFGAFIKAAYGKNDEQTQGSNTHSKMTEISEEKPFQALSLDEMKSRAAAQREALRAQGLDDLAGLLDPDDDK